MLIADSMTDLSLVLSDLPSCTTKEELEGKFPNAIVTLEKNGK